MKAKQFLADHINDFEHFCGGYYDVVSDRYYTSSPTGRGIGTMIVKPGSDLSGYDFSQLESDGWCIIDGDIKYISFMIVPFDEEYNYRTSYDPNKFEPLFSNFYPNIKNLICVERLDDFSMVFTKKCGSLYFYPSVANITGHKSFKDAHGPIYIPGTPI